MDDQSEEFLTKESRLADEGAQERAKYQDAYERKVDKQRKDAEKKGSRKKKTGAEARVGHDEESDSD